MMERFTAKNPGHGQYEDSSHAKIQVMLHAKLRAKPHTGKFMG